MDTIIDFLGRFHPLWVHFPISLLLVAFLFECLTYFKRWQNLSSSVELLVHLGSFSALVSSILGYLLSISGDYSGDLFNWHFYLGMATCITSVLCSFFIIMQKRDGLQKRWPFQILLMSTVILVSITGHYGGSLTHGEGYLFNSQRGEKDEYDVSEIQVLKNQFSKLDTLSIDQKEHLNLKVRGIIAHHCYQCHSEFKKKGGLALDSKRGVFQGGESGVVIVEGSPSESEISRRIHLPSNHDEVMPKKGKTLHSTEIELIDLWIKEGAYWSDRVTGAFKEAPLALEKPDINSESGMPHTIDKIVDDYFSDNRVKWPERIDDRAFIRRAYLDITGLLPDADLVDRFVDDPDQQKREKWIDYLLSDNENYTQHWLTFWNDLLRNDYSGPGFITGGRKEITDWLYRSLESNKSYDQMVRELVNPDEDSEGFIKGIQWRGVVNASQRTEMQAAQNIGQSLMGVNVKCASCHNSFVSNLTLKQSYGFASIFAKSPLELNRCDKPTGVMSKVSFLYNELGSVEADSLEDRLELLEQVMVQPENGRLYRTFVNRIWKALLGRGLVEPVDEMDNDPWNPKLLDWLAVEFIESDTDIKQLIKTIMTSRIYQSASIKVNSKKDLSADSYVFEGPVKRRLSAEQFSDAISKVISPMYYAVGYDPCDQGLSSNRFWYREEKFDRRVLPEPGERYYRWSTNLDLKTIKQAKVIVSVDHSYEMFLNGALIMEGKDWKKVQNSVLLDVLKNGKNIFAIRASNEGTLANPAGILFALRLSYKDGTEKILQPMYEWKSTNEQPSKGWKEVAFDDEDWEGVSNYHDKHWDQLLEFKFDEQPSEFARASLVKQHPFLKALGRPTRENVSTSRDQQATLLQALELTNGEFMMSILENGANVWKSRFEGNSEEMIQEMYRQLLSRDPSSKEIRIISKMLGEEPTSEAIQDVFWSILLLPEFQFIS